jgi:hypothetical protein
VDGEAAEFLLFILIASVCGGILPIVLIKPMLIPCNVQLCLCASQKSKVCFFHVHRYEKNCRNLRLRLEIYIHTQIFKLKGKVRGETQDRCDTILRAKLNTEMTSEKN